VDPGDGLDVSEKGLLHLLETGLPARRLVAVLSALCWVRCVGCAGCAVVGAQY